MLRSLAVRPVFVLHQIWTTGQNAMKIYLKILLFLIILTLTAGLSWHFYGNKPKARKARPQRPVPLVKTISVQPSNEPVFFEAAGTVIPARTVELRTEVEGRIIEQNPELVLGGIISKEELLIRIDPRDYQFQVQERQAELVTAQYELEVEQGKQTIAQQEWRILKREVNRGKANQNMILRKPHLRHAKAKVTAAESRLAAAKLAEERTVIRAPFTGIVLTEEVEQGQFMGRQSTLATLVALDTFQVQVAVPISLLNRVQFPDAPGKKGSRVEIIMDKGDSDTPLIREGWVFKLLADLDPTSRLVRLLITVEDPLNLRGEDNSGAQGRLLLGSFVKVRIDAGTLENVCVIPEKALREGNRVWLMNQEGLLDSRAVKVRWQRIGEVLVDADIGPDEQMIVSRLQTPLPGMRVREEQASQSSQTSRKPR
ncbi:MAG: efflux RND transporter periplasmic adaptor subunit [Candidatus Electrothrix sp. AU1_5]|nr:efflux RND transporter periplasmic adaptor subunit [Candidatus Electrothrix gigas]